MTSTATLATKTLRKIWPKPITLRTTQNEQGELEVTAGRGVRLQAVGAAEILSNGLGVTWEFVRLTNLRGSENIRITYRLAPKPATFDGISRPHEWKIGQADEKTVIARHAAISDLGLRTGYQAEAGQLVVHVELGTPGIYVRSEPGCSYVRFARETDETLVHPGDVVVLADSTDWIGCWITEDASHLEHGEAVTPECILGDPPADLEGPALVENGPSSWIAADGILVTADRADGTFWAYDLSGIPGAVGTHRDRIICANQPTIEHTYRPINERRAAIAAHADAMHEIVADVDAAITVVGQMRTAVAQAEDAERRAFDAGQPGNFERNRVYRARAALVRAELILAYLLDDRSARLVTVEASYDEGATWEMFGSGAKTFGRGETAAEHALRYATEQRYAGPDRWRAEPHPLRVRVYTDPQSLVPAGEWTNFTDPCPAGQHDNDGNRVSYTGYPRPDGSKVETSRCARCGHGTWRVRPFGVNPVPDPSPWQLEGEPLPVVEPGVLCLPVACITTRHYGMEIDEGFGSRRTLVAVGPVNPGTGKVDVYTNPQGVALGAGPDPRGRDLLDAAYRGHLAWDRERGDRFIYIGDRHHETVSAADANRIVELTAAGYLAYDPTKGFNCVTTLSPAWDFLPHQSRADAFVQLRPAPGGGPGPDPAPTQTPDRDLPLSIAVAVATHEVRGPGSEITRPVQLRYRVRTATDGGWRIVQTGTLPPIFPGVSTGLRLAGDTVLGNARQVLRLGPKDPMPAVTVETWDRRSGLTATITRP